MPPPIRIVGCGRRSMGDDQAGLLVAERLWQMHLPRAEVVVDEAPGSELAGGLSEEVELLVVVDAALADAVHAAGSFERIDYRSNPQIIKSRTRADTHSLSVATGLELAETLGLLPKTVWVYAIFGKDFTRRLDLCPETAAGIEPLAERIKSDLGNWPAAGK